MRLALVGARYLALTAAVGCTDAEVFETVAVTALFNFMDRMADALGAPVEGFQDMIESMSRTE